MILLSILIPTTPDRHEMFSELYVEIFKQNELIQTNHPSLGHVEILVDNSKKFLEGGLSIGKKRDALMKRAEGKYLCFVDSDDKVSANYLETILRLCHQNTDVIAFRSFCMTEKYWTLIDMSLKYHMNDQASPDFIVRRRPWHICPVRSSFAMMYEFENINYGEDWNWFEKVLTHCTTEAKTKIYQNYVLTYLNPAMDALHTCPSLRELAMMDSNYSKLDRASPEKLKSLEEKIGIRYYPMAPFILERLFSIFIHNNKINVSWL